jgi:hypothetical protein
MMQRWADMIDDIITPKVPTRDREAPEKAEASRAVGVST